MSKKNDIFFPLGGSRNQKVVCFFCWCFSGQSMAVPTSKKKVQDERFRHTQYIQHWQNMWSTQWA